MKPKKAKLRDRVKLTSLPSSWEEYHDAGFGKITAIMRGSEPRRYKVRFEDDDPAPVWLSRNMFALCPIPKPKPEQVKIKAWIYPGVFGNMVYQFKESGTVPCVISMNKEYYDKSHDWGTVGKEKL